jgi:hypothetical protein
MAKMEANNTGNGGNLRFRAHLLACMTVHPGQPLCSSQILVGLWLSGKNEPAAKCCAVPELELVFLA